MNPITVLGSAAIVGSIFVLWWGMSSDRRGPVNLGIAHRLPEGTDRRTSRRRQTFGERSTSIALERINARFHRMLPRGRTAALAAKIQHAGSPEGWTVERVIAAKVLLSLSFGMLLATRLVTNPSPGNLVLALGAGVFGYVLPNGLLDSKANRRRAAIRIDVADTIDQIGVMVRAGLGIDAAMARVAKSGVGPLATELVRVGQDQRVGVSRTIALANLAERADVPELRGFVAALTQAEKLGIPVSQTLEVQSAELRTRQRQLAEEQAMKLPVKILFPMVVFILPVIFIVLLGPAAIRIMEQFSR